MSNQLILFLEETIRKQDKSNRQFARDIGISPGYLNNILSGKQRAGTKFFKAFSDFTHVTIDSLVAMQEADENDPHVERVYDVDLTPFQLELLKWWQSLTPDQQEAIRENHRRRQQLKKDGK